MHRATMISVLRVIPALLAALAVADPAVAGGRATLAREAIELVAGRGARELAERASRESAEQLVEVAVKELGPEALELEAKSPGLARQVFTVFGTDNARKIATTVPAEDLPRLLAYAERADSPQTRALLLEAYEREGRSLFERIPPKLVLAGGLSAAVIYGSHRTTAPLAALGTQIEQNPDLARRTLDWAAGIGGAVILLVTTSILWRLGLFRRHTASRVAAA